MRDYNVVFEGQGGPNSNHAGIRTITSFESKEAFDKWKETSSNRDLVVAEGIPFEEASRLASNTSIEARFDALEDEIAQHPELAELRMMNTLFALMHDVAEGHKPPIFREEQGW